jgi:predicted DNA-binding protein (MmcQ/YjbR family)
LLENEDIVASPYLARAYWVTLLKWDALRPREIEEELRRAYELIYAKLPARTRKVLALPEKERGKVICERKKVVKAQNLGK